MLKFTWLYYTIIHYTLLYITLYYTLYYILYLTSLYYILLALFIVTESTMKDY